MRNKHRVAPVATVVIVALLVAVGVGAPASAGGRRPAVSPPWVDGLAGPLQLEIIGDGKVLVGQSFSGVVSTVTRRGTQTDLFSDPGVDGVAEGKRRGTVVYTWTYFPDPETDPDGVPAAELRARTTRGQTWPIADLRAYEEANNPDGDQEYGVFGLSDECYALFGPDDGVIPYTGIVDSHPYAVSRTHGGWYVADAGANTIWYVSERGRVSTAAVLPAQEPVTITAEAAEALDLPPCTVGGEFVAEPVPTDVEKGRDGRLYVSTLPGGPEDPAAGARGGVYKVRPWSGSVRMIGSGFAGATNLAVSRHGSIYVSELFGNQVSKLVDGGPRPIAQVPNPGGLEWRDGYLVAGIDVFGSGKIVTIRP